MKKIPELQLQTLAGTSPHNLIARPIPPYSPQVINFLAELSRDLLSIPECRSYPDITAFAFWCRPSNLNRLAREFDCRRLRIGRGLVLHIAPGNIPVNFAFTLAFGMLAGNANIVRVPSGQNPQVMLICNAILTILSKQAYSAIASMNSIVEYPRDNTITAQLSVHAHARVLWGGDETIANLRSIPAAPRCIDVSFADRYSLALLNSKTILEQTDQNMLSLANNFFNDVYLEDQNACSSPHLIIWYGEAAESEMAQNKFWLALVRVIEERYKIAPIHAVDKFVHSCRTAINLHEAKSLISHGGLAHRVQLTKLPEFIHEHRSYAGFFFEFRAENLDCLENIVDARYQTLTCYGVDRDILAKRIIEMRLTGIDRVVPVGKALDIGLTWDGYDLIETLSRIISTN